MGHGEGTLADYLIGYLTKTYAPTLKRNILKRVVHAPVDIERLMVSAVYGTVTHGITQRIAGGHCQAYQHGRTHPPLRRDRCRVRQHQIAGGKRRSQVSAERRLLSRRGKFYRCTADGKAEPLELNCYAAVAVAGLRALPDTLASRAIIIRMKRRAPDETVEPFRIRRAENEAAPLRESLVEWCCQHGDDLKAIEPDLPEGIDDRAADIWEPLIAIADAAGGDWPKAARAAAIHFTKEGADEGLTNGVELLEHIHQAFSDREVVSTKELLQTLINRDESPWADYRGKA
jgi:hypothetical protein